MKIFLDDARRVIEEKIARPLEIDVERAAAGIIAVINANMIRGIRRVSVEKGYDPREFSLVAFGGAGPLHAVELARALNMTKIIIPAYPGIASAFGMLSADVRHDYVQTYIAVSDKVDAKRLQSIYQRMEKQGIHQLSNEGFSDQSIIMHRYADLRYVRQAYELQVPLKNGMLTTEDISSAAQSFHAQHERNYGYARRSEPVEFVNLRLVALGKLPEMQPAKTISKGNKALQPIDYRKVFFEGTSPLKTAIYQREHLHKGQYISGPAIVEQLDSTIVIFPNYQAVTDPYGNLLITSQRE